MRRLLDKILKRKSISTSNDIVDDFDKDVRELNMILLQIADKAMKNELLDGNNRELDIKELGRDKKYNNKSSYYGASLTYENE